MERCGFRRSRVELVEHVFDSSIVKLSLQIHLLFPCECSSKDVVAEVKRINCRGLVGVTSYLHTENFFHCSLSYPSYRYFRSKFSTLLTERSACEPRWCRDETWHT